MIVRDSQSTSPESILQRYVRGPVELRPRTWRARAAGGDGLEKRCKLRPGRGLKRQPARYPSGIRKLERLAVDRLVVVAIDVAVKRIHDGQRVLPRPLIIVSGPYIHAPIIEGAVVKIAQK